jgi:hypothetical protein
VPVTILAARRDNTAIAFLDAWDGPAFADARAKATLIDRDTASHSFASAEDKAWLFEQVREVLK